jgi:leucine dehydrogenase
MYEHPDFDQHERIVHFYDKHSGLKAIIAIHSTALGPAAGGCRLWTYNNGAEALTDALRLSRGMSYKNAMAGLPFGGGKSVILGPVADDQRTDRLLAFGEAVESMAGNYITAEDVGVGVSDMDMVALRTRYVTGLSKNGVVGGDPSPFTARGVVEGIKATVKAHLGTDSLKGLRIAVQGLGHVGSYVCEGLYAEGAKLLVSDIQSQRVNEIVARFEATPVALDEILDQDVDILAPCALGGIITPKKAETIKAKLVAGAANNQLSIPEAGKVLHERGILYAPDYVINAGGIIMVSSLYTGTIDLAKVETIVDAIGPRLIAIYERAKAESTQPELVSDLMAKDIINKAKRSLKGVKPSVLFA